MTGGVVSPLKIINSDPFRPPAHRPPHSNHPYSHCFKDRYELSLFKHQNKFLLYIYFFKFKAAFSLKNEAKVEKVEVSKCFIHMVNTGIKMCLGDEI